MRPRAGGDPDSLGCFFRPVAAVSAWDLPKGASDRPVASISSILSSEAAITVARGRDHGGCESDRRAGDDGGDDADSETPDADEGDGWEGDDQPVGVAVGE